MEFVFGFCVSILCVKNTVTQEILCNSCVTLIVTVREFDI